MADGSPASHRLSRRTSSRSERAVVSAFGPRADMSDRSAEIRFPGGADLARNEPRESACDSLPTFPEWRLKRYGKLGTYLLEFRFLQIDVGQSGHVAPRNEAARALKRRGYIAPYAKVGIGRRQDEKSRLSFRAGRPITDDSPTSGPVIKRPQAVNLIPARPEPQIFPAFCRAPRTMSVTSLTAALAMASPTGLQSGPSFPNAGVPFLGSRPILALYSPRCSYASLRC
jgi:hypothetical protein